MHDVSNVLFVSLLLLVLVLCWVLSAALRSRFANVHQVMKLACVDALYPRPYGFGVRGVSLFAASSSKAVVVGQD